MNVGDFVEIVTDEETLRGIVVPSPDENTIVLKLQSGYNIGVYKSKIKSTKVIEPSKESKKQGPKEHEKHDKGQKNISILHTGGTIASKVDYKTGGVVAKFDADEMLNLFPELKRIANVRSVQIMQSQSEMIRFAHYNLMANAIFKEIEEHKPDGIIVTHGTDTLHYSSAALSFMLENLPVPVILVGAQRSSDRPSTDASLNLISAAYFAAQANFSGVAICMHSSSNDTECSILPATKSRKMHTSRRDAFRPINSLPIAKVNFEEQKIEFLSDHQKRGHGKTSLTEFKEDLKIAIIKSHPNMLASQFTHYKDYEGLIIEGTGLGHIPNQQTDSHNSENEKIHTAVANLIKGGTVVVMTAQTIYGRINLNVYTPQRELVKIGVLGHLCDMTPETAFIKLAWLLSNYPKEEVKHLITKDLRGEISRRSAKETFLA